MDRRLKNEGEGIEEYDESYGRNDKTRKAKEEKSRCKSRNTEKRLELSNASNPNFELVPAYDRLVYIFCLHDREVEF